MYLTPVKAIRAKRLDCCCGQAKEVRLCVLESCPLFPYRMGRRPEKQLDVAKVAGVEKMQVAP